MKKQIRSVSKKVKSTALTEERFVELLGHTENRLKTEIKDAWDLETHFGNPIQPIKVPHAVIKTAVERQPGVRYVHELYTFTIVGWFKFTTGSIEEQLMEKAELLIQKLHPYTLDTDVPTQGYNGGFMNYVTKVNGYYREEVDLMGIELEFKVMGRVNS